MSGREQELDSVPIGLEIDCLNLVSIKLMLKRSVFYVEGAIMLSAGRPVDCLRQLLIECGGPEAEAVRGYFGLQVRFFSL